MLIVYHKPVRKSIGRNWTALIFLSVNYISLRRELNEMRNRKVRIALADEILWFFCKPNRMVNIISSVHTFKSTIICGSKLHLVSCAIDLGLSLLQTLSLFVSVYNSGSTLSGSIKHFEPELNRGAHTLHLLLSAVIDSRLFERSFLVFEVQSSISGSI